MTMAFGSLITSAFVKLGNVIHVLQTKCERERATSDDPRRKHEFRPVCNDDGTYHEVQCSIEDTTCWCVNKHGKKTVDVLTGVNGLHCFTPRDLSSVAIFVLMQGIVMALLMIAQIINVYTKYSITKIVINSHDYYKQRIRNLKKGYEPLQKKKDKKKKIRQLPSIPVGKRELPSTPVEKRQLPSIPVEKRQLPSIPVEKRLKSN